MVKKDLIDKWIKKKSMSNIKEEKMTKRLSEKQINAMVELLKEGKPLPEEYRWLLFEGKQETELIYAGKTRDVDVLAETMAVPLQKVKVFGDVRDEQ